jgi:hypothetical protein
MHDLECQTHGKHSSGVVHMCCWMALRGNASSNVRVWISQSDMEVATNTVTQEVLPLLVKSQIVCTIHLLRAAQEGQSPSSAAQYCLLPIGACRHTYQQTSTAG